MISVLICSANDLFLNQVRDDVRKTIGLPHEILYVDNSKEKRGICAVYNYLASKASFPYLCFVHEDIVFETRNWGVIIKDIFSRRTDVGVIGIAGSKYKAKRFSGWFSGIKEFDCANVTHQYAYGNESIHLNPNNQNKLEEVVCIDGVFICCRKSIWEKIKFNEKRLRGFHFYDIDFSLNAAAVSTVAVTYDIDVVHITKGGDFGNAWVETAIDFHSFYTKLPDEKLVDYSPEKEDQIARVWLDVLKKYQISWRNKMKWIRIQHLQSRPMLYYSILKFLFYKPFGLKAIHKLFRKVR